MVSTAWLLLSLFACKAEDIGVQLPLRGPLAINQEDLKRDLWLRMQSTTSQKWQHKIAGRLASMGLSATGSFCSPEGRCCMGYTGQGESIEVEVVDDNRLPSMVATAALISVAKSFDKSKKTRMFCIHRGTTKITKNAWEIADLTGKEMDVFEEKKQFSSRDGTTDPENLDYRILEKHVRKIAEVLAH